MDVREALLESWDRQAAIVNTIASLVQPTHLNFRPAPSETTVAFHLCHIHEVRYFWLNKVSPEHAKDLGDVFVQVDDDWEPITDLTVIREQLALSGRKVGEAVRELLARDVQSVGGYDHPALFLQHMVWHDGWHVGIIMLALRVGGFEPSEEWEEEHIWGQWRAEE